jgi:NADPH oxidase
VSADLDHADLVSGFHSLLQAVEQEDTENRIEIHIYLTAKIE